MKIFARALLALLLPALVVSGYVFLPAAQAPSQEVAASEFQVSVDPADLEIVCAGALIEVGGEDGTELDLIERPLSIRQCIFKSCRRNIYCFCS